MAHFNIAMKVNFQYIVQPWQLYQNTHVFNYFFKNILREIFTIISILISDINNLAHISFAVDGELVGVLKEGRKIAAATQVEINEEEVKSKQTLE